MSGALEPRPGRPVDFREDDALQVPSVRLDDPAALRAEVERLRAELAVRPPAGRSHRESSFGRWRTSRTDDAQPLRAAATGDRRAAAADMVLGLKALGAFGLAVLGLAAAAVVLTVLYGLLRLAGRFAAWSADGSALAGGLLLVVAAVAIAGTGLWLFLRLTGSRRAER